MIIALTRLAAAAAVIALLAAPAMAQVRVSDLPMAEQDEIFCVYEGLEDDFELVAEEFLYDDMPADERKNAIAALDKAANACAASYKWADAKRDRARRVGRYGAVADYLDFDLELDKVKSEDIDKLPKVLNGMSRDEQRRFLDDSWMDDRAFIARVDSALTAAGFPKDDDGWRFETARFYMEASTLAAAAIEEWLAAR
jgi:hypothetical protein